MVKDSSFFHLGHPVSVEIHVLLNVVEVGPQLRQRRHLHFLPDGKSGRHDFVYRPLVQRKLTIRR